MIDDRDLAVPATLVVAFPRTDGTDGTDGAYSVTLTLAGLAAEGWLGSAGGGRPVVLRAATAYDGTNATALAALARRMALDWLAWRRGRAHLSLIGAAPWVPDGYTVVEWEASAALVCTRAVRVPLDVPRGLVPPACCAAPACGACYEYFEMVGPALAYVGPDNVWRVLDLDSDGTLTVASGELVIVP